MNKIFKRGCAVFLAMATAFSLLSTVSLAAEDGTANEGAHCCFFEFRFGD